MINLLKADLVPIKLKYEPCSDRDHPAQANRRHLQCFPPNPKGLELNSASNLEKVYFILLEANNPANGEKT